MPLRDYKCSVCDETFKSFKSAPEHCNMPAGKLLSAPQSKFMEPTNKEKGYSKLRDQDKIVKARSRNHSRDHEIHDIIQGGQMEKARAIHWIKANGQTRGKIDDI